MNLKCDVYEKIWNSRERQYEGIKLVHHNVTLIGFASEGEDEIYPVGIIMLDNGYIISAWVELIKIIQPSDM